MTPQDVLNAAKQGNPQAIAALMNRSLQPKGITARARLVDGTLQVMLEGDTPPSQAESVGYVNKVITCGLGFPAIISHLVIAGKAIGSKNLEWTERIELIPRQQAIQAPKISTSPKKENPQSTPGRPASGLKYQAKKRKWYEIDSPIIIVGLLILFFPLGLWLMWKYSKWSRPLKWAATGVVVVYVLALPHQKAPPSVSSTGVVDSTISHNEGEQIFQKMNGTYELAGLGTSTPIVRVIVPQEGWNALTQTDKVNLANYTESLISRVKAEPAKYMDTPSTAPIYESFIAKGSNLCQDCWSIVVSFKNSKPYSIDKTVVQGETPWKQDDPCCRGENISELKK